MRECSEVALIGPIFADVKSHIPIVHTVAEAMVTTFSAVEESQRRGADPVTRPSQEHEKPLHRHDVKNDKKGASTRICAMTNGA